MNRVLVAAILASSAIVHADEPATGAVDDHLERARAFHDRGDFEHARDELLAAYQLAPRPELLFALGQIEFNLHHYKEAIDYYERFNATGPDADQAALAQQAIGAARIELSRPPPPPPAPPPRFEQTVFHRRWDVIDTGLVVIGGLAAAAGGGLLVDMRHLADDHTGTLAEYDQRIDRAHTRRLDAEACFAGGALAIGAALIRWRVHLVETVIEVHAGPGGGGVTLGRPF